MDESLRLQGSWINLGCGWCGQGYVRADVASMGVEGAVLIVVIDRARVRNAGESWQIAKVVAFVFVEGLQWRLWLRLRDIQMCWTRGGL